MTRSILITGGARSGKSTLAERKALGPRGRAVYIATAMIYEGDDEMVARIAEHRARRGEGWQELHAPLDLAAALRSSDGDLPRLVDCLTLWLTNLMLGGKDWRAEVQALVKEIARQHAPVVFVSNEVGAGIVPETRLGREFRDAAGWMNQAVAAACDEVWLAVAGYPVKVKPNEHSF
ncbi:bifunctional adenosylcobinamide kinase/adenosylcobinamide-phosphate guanylyltransferase [Salipiger sp. H15]|uniref:Bifunctional adenosylcobalamin biosynthesis protein n=1 Tax=Alloyangia sp. H15 TaxID=3029062 RepID=A0AAU8AM11_9RHOB